MNDSLENAELVMSSIVVLPENAQKISEVDSVT